MGQIQNSYVAQHCKCSSDYTPKDIRVGYVHNRREGLLDIVDATSTSI